MIQPAGAGSECSVSGPHALVGLKTWVNNYSHHDQSCECVCAFMWRTVKLSGAESCPHLVTAGIDSRSYKGWSDQRLMIDLLLLTVNTVDQWRSRVHIQSCEPPVWSTTRWILYMNWGCFRVLRCDVFVFVQRVYLSCGLHDNGPLIGCRQQRHFSFTFAFEVVQCSIVCQQ